MRARKRAGWNRQQGREVGGAGEGGGVDPSTRSGGSRSHANLYNFSKVSSILIAYGKLLQMLTFENFYSPTKVSTTRVPVYTDMHTNT